VNVGPSESLALLLGLLVLGAFLVGVIVLGIRIAGRGERRR
jgi:hypothetical protein